MRLQGIAIAAAAAFVCAYAAPALAGDWQPAHKLSIAGSDPQVAFLQGGEATIAWGPRAPTAGEAGGAGIQAVRRPPGGDFGSPFRVASDAGVAPRIVVGPDGHELVAWADEHFKLAFTVRPPGSAFGEIRRIADAGPGDVGLDGQGNVYALVNGGDNPMRYRWEGIVTAPADGSPMTVREVVRDQRLVDPTLAVDAAGNVTVAWHGTLDGESYRDSHIYAADAAPGQAFGPPQTLSGPFYDNRRSNAALRTVGNARGDVLVVWPQQENPPADPILASMVNDAVIYVAYKPAGGSFGPPRRIAPPGGHAGLNGYDAALGRHGEALVGWTDMYAVMMSFAASGGRFEPGRAAGRYPYWDDDVHPTVYRTPRIAFDAAGNATVLYSTDSDRKLGRTIEAVRHPASGDFEPPQHVTDKAPVNDATLALGPDGEAIAAWSPQSRLSSSPSDKDFGIYVADYAANGRPRVDHAALRRGVLALEASDAGRAFVVVRRGGRTVVRHRRRVRPGRNTVQLTRRERRKLRRRGAYVATVTVRDRRGRTSRPRRLRFHALH